MTFLDDANTVIAIFAITLLTAVIFAGLARKWMLPMPAILLGGGVLVASVTERLPNPSIIEALPLVGTIGLIVVLFDGGFSNGGWPRTRPTIGLIVGMGVVGTLLTAGLLAVFCVAVLGMPTEIAALIAIALAPTDPAAVFSVLGAQDVKGSADVVLEGESGANDPVGIALMIGAIEYINGHGSFAAVVTDFVFELAVGVIMGVLCGVIVVRVLTAVRLGTEPLQALAMLASAFAIYSITVPLHGSGFLAVFVAALVIGAHTLPSSSGTSSVMGTSAAIGEMVMFLLLGVTVEIALVRPVFVDALLIFLALTLLVRPLVTFSVLAPSSLTRNEKTFIAWGGLKGAVPILLAAFVVLADVPSANVVYLTVFVAVAASIAIQGISLPWLAQRYDLLDAPHVH